MVVNVTVECARQWPDEISRLLRSLPEWFGIEQSIVEYTAAARTLPTTVALKEDELVSACVVRRHTEVSAEIEVLAVARAFHRQGIGRLLVARVEADLARDGVHLLEVKTRGPSGESEPYERTRAFYRALGFLPLEERFDIWGPDNPCLICVKPLG